MIQIEKNTSGLNEIIDAIITHCKTLTAKEEFKDIQALPAKFAMTRSHQILEFKKIIEMEGFDYQLDGVDIAANWERKVKKGQTLQVVEIHD